MQKKPYRLGIDMGSTSIGWCMLELDSEKNPCGIINMGVRIFPDGREDYHKTPLSVIRREKRGQRRLFDRRRWRTQHLVKLLIQSHLLPENDAERANEFLKDPLFLRNKALDEEVTLYEFGRILMHISKHRGFKSNRKAEKGDNKKSKYTTAIDNCIAKIDPENSIRTLGEYLWNINKMLNTDEVHREEEKKRGFKPKKGNGKMHLKEPVRFRYDGAKKDLSIIFPTREILQNEFSILWDIQSEYRSELTDELKERIRFLIFEQMKLKSQKHAIGYCYLESDERRCPKADPLFQEFRLWQTINNLRIKDIDENIERKLSLDEKQSIFKYLNTKTSATFISLRKKIYPGNADRYQFTDEVRKKAILGNETEAIFHSKENAAISQIWDSFDDTTKSKVIEILVDNLDEENQIQLVKALGISQSDAERLVQIDIPPKLEGYCNLSLVAINKLLPHMREGMMYSEACIAIGKSHSSAYTGEIFDSGNLPYYGVKLKRQSIPLNRPSNEPNADKHGKINNPTVHVALNQLRKVLNAICERYGPPTAIHLEMGKDVPMSAVERSDISTFQENNEKRNNEIAEVLSSLDPPIKATKENILKYKLWQQISMNEFERYCIYTGRNIGIHKLFTADIEIDHILPKTKTYDDSMANKLLAFKDANDFKNNRTPYEAFHNNPPGYDWQGILQRASTLPDSKQWRFLNNALEMYLGDKEPIARMMADTRYMAVAAREYLSYICGEDNIVSCTGRLTSNLRHEWGLNKILNDDANEKNRRDHRHHAIDAFVIACSDRSTIKKYAIALQKTTKKHISKMDKPYLAFSPSIVAEFINKLYVSYKPNQTNPQKMIQNNQTAGALLDSTAYGYVGKHPQDPDYSRFRLKKEISALKPQDVAAIKSDYIRKALIKHLEETNGDMDMALSKFENIRNNHQKPQTKIKRVSLLYKLRPSTTIEDEVVEDLGDVKDKTMPITVVPVCNRFGRPYKYLASDENIFADIYSEKPKDKDFPWKMEIIRSVDAHQKNFVPNWKKKHPMAKLIMRLYKDDIVAFTNDDGNREMRRVRKISGEIFCLREVNIARKPDGVGDDVGEKFSYMNLQKRGAKKAGIDIIGRCFDPGGKTDAGDRT